MIDFSHSQEQILMANSLDRLLLDIYPFTGRLNIVQAGSDKIHPGFNDTLWMALSELGITAIMVPEAFDGLGGNAEDIMVIMQQVGKHLLVAPLLSSAVLGTLALSQAATQQQKEQRLPALASGEQRTALAVSEPQGYGLAAVFATTAQTTAHKTTLCGHKSLVHFGQVADYIIVAAQQGDEQGLYLLEANSPGVKYCPYRTHDGGAALDLHLDHAPVERLGEGEDAAPLIRYLWDLGAVAVCAEALGCMDAIYQQTRDYLKIREQFGAPLASFQSLQHRLVDMHIACELSRSITCDAVWSIDHAESVERNKAVSAAKVLIGQHGVQVGKEGVQLHGGIGMTMALPIGHYLKRLTLINQQFGDVVERLKRYQRLIMNESRK